MVQPVWAENATEEQDKQAEAPKSFVPMWA